MADPTIDKALDLSRRYVESDRPQPELKAYDFPWYKALPHAITDLVYGPTANAQQGAWINKLFGTENPFNIPGQAQEAGHTLGQGIKSSDPAMTLGGLAAAGLMLMPGARRGAIPAFAKDEALAAAKPVSGPIRAYHGSPHDFDKFDLSKIGTGEGAQAYGHGLYFAEQDAVAKDYRKRLSPKTDLESAAQDLAEENGRSWGDMGAYERQSYIDEAEKQGLTGSKAPNGRMYEVAIHASPDDFLDWDKPLSQQSEKVRGAIEKLPSPATSWYGPDGGTQTFKVGDNPRGLISKTGDGYEARAWFGVGKDVEKFKTAADARQWLESKVSLEDGYGPMLRNPNESQRLREAGIPGIRYLDQGSRNAGEGSRNYVLFRDDIIDIIRKYGIAAVLGLGATSGAFNPPPALANPKP